MRKSSATAVTSSEPYYTPGCITNAQCVFPNAIIPQQRVVGAGPTSAAIHSRFPNIGPATFSTASDGQILRDDKGSLRIDGNSDRWGLLSAYYFFDDYNLEQSLSDGARRRERSRLRRAEPGTRRS